MTAKTYYELAKPGIVYGNIMTAAAGFLLAARHHVDLWLLLATLLGTSCIIGSACVFNNYIDRDIDKKMARTRKRSLANGLVSSRSALIYAVLLGCIGLVILALFVNWLVVAIGAVGFIDYVVLYGISKRRSVHGTLVGSVSGAMPIVAGYVAVTDRLDGGALILFLIMALWQMPHFYAIAIYRLKDYASAGLPVLPVKEGVARTKMAMLYYIVAFIAATVALATYGYAGSAYLVVMALLGITWLGLCMKGFNRQVDERSWAREMFFFSLIVVTGLSAMLALNALLA